MMKKTSLRAISPNILATHQIDASKIIQSSTIHPTSNRDVRRETVDRVNKQKSQSTITGNPGEKPPSPSRRVRRGNKAGQLRQGEHEPPETEAGYTRQTDRDIPESPVTEEEPRQTKASSHLLLREGF
ncbi:hypothetical protein DY000_02029947 [Brassica cretica]|uniref:Uncharacterized protein n=1 Tax=Brassica cretica TaxID=69181 RepID=A0ABQ7DIH9_BRACR|nr:hypothetical protein DY000_02029947 [Brassica cretica]